MNIVIVAHWHVVCCVDKYYIANTHYSYCQYLVENNHSVHLVCRVEHLSEIPTGYHILEPEIKIYSLPKYRNYWTVYFSAFKFYNFFSRLFRTLHIDLLYVRAPDPFCWLPAMLVSKSTKVNYHFVGDSIDATLHSSEKIWKKYIKVLFYIPEYLALILSCKFFGDSLFCNGPHLRDRLKKIGLNKVKVVISSTVSRSDIVPLTNKSIETNNKLRLLYVGYLRPAKGVLETLEVVKELISQFPNISLSIIGTGEDSTRLRNYVKNHQLENTVTFFGHIDEKKRLYDMYQCHDFFCFFSFSEGSPRVVIEAMINGLVVISSPVGSLPYCFNDNQEILLTDDFSKDAIKRRILDALKLNNDQLARIRMNAYDKVKENYLKEQFLKDIFS